MKLRHKTLAKVGIVGAAIAGAALATAPVATAAAAYSGLAFITNPTTGQPKNSAASETEKYQVQPVQGGKCTGSSQNGYFVTGYLSTVNIQANPGAFTWDADGPHTASGVTWPLIDDGFSPYVNRNTADPVATGEGPVNATGALTWDGFTSSDIPNGTYHIGLACIVNNTLDRFYDTKIQVTATSGGHFGWTTDPNPQVPEFPMAVVLPVSAGLLAAAGAFVLHRRRQSSTVAAAV